MLRAAGRSSRVAEAQMNKILHAVAMPDRFHFFDRTVAIMNVDIRSPAARDGRTSKKVTAGVSTGTQAR